jgi:hypothetical protein
MKQMNYIKIGAKVVLCAFILALAGCSKVGSSGNQSSQTVVVMLFDISGSTSATAIRQRYQKEFDTVLQEVGNNTVVMADRITDNSLATSSFPVNITFPAYNMLEDSAMTHNKKMKKLHEEADEQVKQIFSNTSKYPHTDLMNAFQLAAKVFNGDTAKGAKNKVLVVFSDMFEQSAHYNFVSLNLDKTKTQQIVNKEKGEGTLPDLNGVKVWISGAGATGNSNIPSSKLNQIRDFWLQYFKATGADFSTTRYSASLINFSLPKD